MGNGQLVTRGGVTYRGITDNSTTAIVPQSSSRDLFTLRSGGVAVGDPGTVERTELAATSASPFDTDVWVSHHVRATGLPDPTSDWTLAMQFRATDDAGEITTRSPVLALELYGNHYIVVTRSDATNPSTVNPDGQIRVSGDHDVTAWHHFVYRVRFARTGNGLLQVWVDGSEALAETAIPVGYNDTLGPVFRYGGYRQAAAPTVSVEHANVEISTTSLLSRVTSPLPIS